MADATRWYAVADESADDLDGRVWTVSKDPNTCGWETDSGFPGYGLSRADAEFLAVAANEKLERELSKMSDSECICISHDARDCVRLRLTGSLCKNAP